MAALHKQRAGFEPLPLGSVIVESSPGCICHSLSYLPTTTEPKAMRFNCLWKAASQMRQVQVRRSGRAESWTLDLTSIGVVAGVREGLSIFQEMPRKTSQQQIGSKSSLLSKAEREKGRRSQPKIPRLGCQCTTWSAELVALQKLCERDRLINSMGGIVSSHMQICTRSLPLCIATCL